MESRAGHNQVEVSAIEQAFLKPADLYLPLNIPDYVRMNVTRQQKAWVKERDNWECQFPLSHLCFGEIQVHHIIAQYYAQAWLGLLEMAVNSPSNLITLCENIHIGVNVRKEPDVNLVHPDHFEARKKYRAGNKLAFQQVAIGHKQMTLEGLKYWNDTNDDLLKVVADERTRKKERHGSRYPDYIKYEK